ncbi:MAG: hypothetical protein JOY82_25710 [Streptosporangiaceae bacterium]|nr:hypothetical protein [Streptosporangiaceae bacterium]MBV9857883.1 hypothetical protein [Streptosporangiaceae bacterium]
MGNRARILSRRADGWPAAAAAVAAVATMSLLLAGCAAGSATPTTQRETISRALVVSGGLHVVVPFTAGGCARGGSALVASETSSTVTLVLWQIVSGGVCPADIAFGTAAVTLHHPLYGRSLVDGTTGRRIPYFDGRNLLPVTYLPPGYRFSAYGYVAAATFSAWEREYTTAGQATAPADVAQVPGSVTGYPSWPLTSAVTVNGRRATMEMLTNNGQTYGRAISWRAAGYTLVVYTAVVQAGQQLLPAAELMRIASGLRS